MTVDRKKLMALRKAEREKKQRPKADKKEFTSEKPGKFFLYRKADNTRIQIHTEWPPFTIDCRSDIETILEQCEYMTDAPPIQLSKDEFAKLEKWLTPLPPNVTVM